jgi:VWFA-related protein
MTITVGRNRAITIRRNRGARRERRENRREEIFLLFFLCVLCGLCGSFLSVLAAQPPPAKPSFQSSVEVTSLDVTVVDDKGKPVAGLTPADFVVRIDGNARRVVSAEWVPLIADGSAPAPPPPDGYSTNESATGGRLIVIAVDQPNIRFGGAMAIARAANAFIDKLAPSDRVAVAGIGLGAPSTTFTSDRARVKQAISRMVGQKSPPMTAMHSVALVEAIAIDHGDQGMLDQVIGRECQGLRGGDLVACQVETETEARAMARSANQEGDETVQGLSALFAGLRAIDAPKTLIFISEGFITNENTGRIIDLGVMAAASRTSLYALKLDTPLFEASAARAPVNMFGDRQAQAEGLEMLAGASRGALFTVTGTGEALFNRIASELSGYYLLAVESDGRDKDGKPHPIRVDVPRKGAIVRSRRQLVTAASDRPAPRSPRAAAAAALSSPLIATALPVRLASFALQGPESNKVQLLIHADVGTDYPASKIVSVGYVITDREGKIVDRKTSDVRLLPVMNGVPSPLQFTTGASLAPGDYTMKLAVAEGDRAGSVEHLVHAALPAASGLTLSELMVGGPLEVGELLTPTIGYQINFGAVHGYLEAYGAKAEGMTMEFEIATEPEAPALLNVDVPIHPITGTRAIFTKVMPTHALPPGKYVLRAILSADGASIKTLTRGFEISPPKVLLTSAEGLGNVSVDAELFLPIDDNTMTPAFVRDQAVDEATLAPFRERVAPATKAAFDQGVVFLAAGDFTKAEQSFKKAIDPDGDSTAPLALLAASFAGAGKDHEAASAWQTALVDGTDFAQIYVWLSEALLRTHDFGAARAILEEAADKWPTDTRFTKPLAMLYGTFGRGREAVRTLERYLDDRQDDRDGYFYAVQWLYTVHAAGAVVHSRAEDRKRAHDYADAYLRARGPQAALVKQWVDYLDSEK